MSFPGSTHDTHPSAAANAPHHAQSSAPSGDAQHYTQRGRSPLQTVAQTVTRGAPEAQVLLGPSLAMSTLWARLQRVAPYFRTTLFTGESGSGQEAAARALYHLSPLNTRGFAVVTAAEADSLLAQETGFQTAAALGMLYLPEPDRLSPDAQAGLLRLLRERGAAAPRLVTFAERGLRSLVSARGLLPPARGLSPAACGFSPELASSLSALQIEVPPLRERVEDIPLLLGHLLRVQAADLGLTAPNIAADFFEAAAQHPWPGNLDQMRSVLRMVLEKWQQLVQLDPPRSAASCATMLHAEDLRNALAALEQTPSTAATEARMVTLDQIVREQVHAVLMACNGNKLRAAEILGISRSTLYRMLGAAGSAWPPPQS